VIVQLLERDDAFGTAYNLAGPGTITMRELAVKILAALGKPPKVRVAGPLLVRLMGLWSPLLRELSEMSYLISDPVLLDDARLRAKLGPIEKTPYDEAIRRLVAGR
jgi:nucleoside-diphosphate-sugar epimerase